MFEMRNMRSDTRKFLPPLDLKTGLDFSQVERTLIDPSLRFLTGLEDNDNKNMQGTLISLIITPFNILQTSFCLLQIKVMRYVLV